MTNCKERQYAEETVEAIRTILEDKEATELGYSTGYPFLLRLIKEELATYEEKTQ